MAKVELDIRAQITNLNKGLAKTEKGLKDLQGQSNRTSKTIQGNMSKTNAVVTKLTGALGAMLTIGAAVQFTKAIIDVRGEFEKFRAVLTNTLGSAEAANKEFAKIQKFAADTPFSVRELADSFVRLVNQGFKPTVIELRKLGDLAASTGKEFIQLTEAIIDAQTGEFERLKEFGIRASKQGDVVKFTFKEIETQVDFTASAIQGYILSLGDMEGVSGAMAAISETLQGKISNLGDSWESLLDTMGGRTSGIMTGVIALLSDLLISIEDLLAGPLDPTIGASTQFDNFRIALADVERDLRAGIIVKEIQRLEGAIDDWNESLANLDLVEDFGSIEDATALKEQLELQIEAYEDLLLQVNKGIDEIDEINEVTEEQAGIIETLTKRIKSLNSERLKSTDRERIAEINIETEALKKQVKALTELGTVAAAEKERKEDAIFTKLQQKLDQEAFDEAFKLAKDETDAYLAELEKREAADKAYSDALNAEMEARVAATLANDARIAQSARIKAQIEQDLVQARGEAVLSGLDLIAAIGKENAQLQQVVAISQAIINGALWITKIGAQAGVLAPPLQIAAGLQTLAQIAIIRQQKFERGGYEVLSGRRHAQGGIPIAIGEGEDGEGHAVFSRRATQKYGKFLPAWAKAIEEGKVDASDPNNFNFFYDDSKQVGKLEDIRKILSKPEVRYEGKYRIEIRNGQRTKVKI